MGQPSEKEMFETAASTSGTSSRGADRRSAYEEHGPGIDHEIPQEHETPSHPELKWPKIRKYLQAPFCEFWGTFMIVMFGDGVVAQVLLSRGEKGDYQSISWGWGLGVMLGVYVGGKSGAHLNPAVTLANCVFRKFPWRKFPVYVVAQVLGGMTAAAIVYGNYRSAIDAFEGYNVRTVASPTNPNGTAGIFCTYPAPFMTTTGQFFSEFIASALLQFLIFAVLDGGNIGAGNPNSNSLVPLCLFFIIFGIGACWGWETGYAINLARDFGPRLVSYMIGYGPEVWTAGNYYFWVPIVAPLCGTVAGGYLYDVFIFEGISPVNTPYMGFNRFLRPTRSTWSNTYSDKV